MTAHAPFRTRPKADAIIRVVAERVQATTRPSRAPARYAIAREAHSYVAHCSPDALKALTDTAVQPDHTWAMHWPGDDRGPKRLAAFIILCTAVQATLPSTVVGCTE